MSADHREWSRGPYRVEMTCQLRFDGPLHIGSGQRLEAATDSPILLHPGSTEPWLPGSSTRGVIRDWCVREAPLLGVSESVLRRLFGYTSDNSNHDRQGRLRVFDATLRGRSDVRDHVRINRQWGAADNGGKFDRGIADPGRQQDVEIRMVYEGNSADDPELLLLRAAAKAMEQGALFFGGHSAFGLGMVREAAVSWTTLDRRSPEELTSFLNDRLAGRSALSAVKPAPTLSADVYELRKNDATKASSENRPLPWSWLKLHLAVQFDGPMLTVGPYTSDDPASTAANVDATFLLDSHGQPVWPGSSIRGVIAERAKRIASTLGPAHEQVAEALFGFVREGTLLPEEDKARRGLLHVGEGHLIDANNNDVAPADVKTVLLNHVAIDRVTGFAADKRLFSTLALASPRFRTTCVVRWRHSDDDEQAAVALLLFVLRDMQQGLMWAGSRTTRGYGHVKTVGLISAQLSRIVVNGGKPSRVFDSVGPSQDGWLPLLATQLDGPAKAWRAKMEKVAS